MDHTFCPGAKLLRQPKPETMPCPSCSEEVEIWSDEIRATCPNCKRTLIRDSNLSCLDWCKYGKECVGDEIYDNYTRNKAMTVKQELLEELDKYFGEDEKRIQHAKDVLSFADGLVEAEEADWHIVIPASILHDVGIKAAEEKYGSSAGRYQEKEGPDIARRILLRIGFRKEDIDQICDIIGHHHSPGKIDTRNFKVLYDADCLVNIREIVDGKAKDEVRKIIEKMFLTHAGKQRAEKLYL